MVGHEGEVEVGENYVAVVELDGRHEGSMKDLKDKEKDKTKKGKKNNVLL